MKPGFLFRHQHSEDSKVTRMKCAADVDLAELLDAFGAFVLAAGFHPTALRRVAVEWADNLPHQRQVTDG